MKSRFIKKRVSSVVVGSTMMKTGLASMNISSALNCPLKLNVCRPICYWHKRGNCMFPLEGYDKWGRIIGK